MNICALSGILSTKPIAVGSGQTIKFSLLTKFPSTNKTTAESTCSVPCVLFNANPKQKEALMSNDHMKLRIELSGRVIRSGFKNRDGVTQYNTEVNVDTTQLVIYAPRSKSE